MATQHNSLRDRQVASIEKVLNLNHASPESADTQHDATLANGLVTKATPILNADGEPIWKVLVFDSLGRDMISSVLRVSDLRSWGVTIHLAAADSDTSDLLPQNVTPFPTSLPSTSSSLLLRT